MDLKGNTSQNDNLTDVELARITKGKERALKIRQSRLTAHPYSHGYNKLFIKIDDDLKLFLERPYL